MSDADAKPQIEGVLAGHRPYGLDCKCGRPINSDEDWARHLLDVLVTTSGLTALLAGVVRVDVIGDRPGMVHEFWADAWMASPQDQGRTLKLFCYGDGDAHRAVRDRALVADLKERIACVPAGCQCDCHKPGNGMTVAHLVACCDQPPAPVERFGLKLMPSDFDELGVALDRVTEAERRAT